MLARRIDAMFLSTSSIRNTEAFLRDAALTIDSLVIDSDMQTALGVSAVPTTVVFFPGETDLMSLAGFQLPDAMAELTALVKSHLEANAPIRARAGGGPE